MLGMDAKLYYGDAVDPASSITPSALTEADNIVDLSCDFDSDEADSTTRANSGWRSTTQTLKGNTITFDIMWDPDDAFFAALKDAYMNNTMLAMAILDQDEGTSGAQGLVANFAVTGFNWSQPIGENQKVDVTIKIKEYGAWYETA